MAKSDESMLSINNIEVLYNNVILALKGVSLDVPKGSIVSLLGANGAGKTTTLKACSRLLEAERGAISKGNITLLGENIASKQPYDMVSEGAVQVLEGRHIFAHLTVEENLLTGSFIRKLRRSGVKDSIDYVYSRFARLKERRKSVAGYLSGGEQQMLAMGRAMMAKPKLILLDEPSMGLAPQLVEEIFNIVKTLNTDDNVSFLVAEQNANIALKYADYGYIIENGRVVLKGEAKTMSENKQVQELYMGTSDDGRVSFRDVKFYHRRRDAFA